MSAVVVPFAYNAIGVGLLLKATRSATATEAAVLAMTAACALGATLLTRHTRKGVAHMDTRARTWARMYGRTHACMHGHILTHDTQPVDLTHTRTPTTPYPGDRPQHGNRTSHGHALLIDSRGGSHASVYQTTAPRTQYSAQGRGLNAKSKFYKNTLISSKHHT